MSMSTASDYWNKIYTENPFKKGKGPDPFVAAFARRLQKGKVLDVGAGEGQNATFLAQKGFNVKGIDLSETALEHAKKLATETGVQVDFHRTDLDLFVMGLMEYDSIIMIDFKPPIMRYYSELIRALKQGGTLLVKSFLDDEMEEALGPDDAFRNFYYHSNELIRQIRDLKILFYNEDLVDGKKVVQCLAQKPLDKDAAKYKLFDMQSDVKSGPSRQRELAEALFKKKN